MKKIIVGLSFLAALSAKAQTLQTVTDNGNVSQRNGENIIFKPLNQGDASYFRWYDADNTALGYMGYANPANRWLFVDNTGSNPVRINPRLIVNRDVDDGVSAIQANGQIRLYGSTPGLVLHNGKMWDISPGGTGSNGIAFNETGINTTLFLSPGGKVGINTTNPQEALQIGEYLGNNQSKILFPGVYNFEKFHLGQEGNGAPFMEFINHLSMTNSYGIKMGTNIDVFGAGFYIRAAPSAASYNELAYASQPAFFVNYQNQVGIGTANTAGYKLAVAGTMIAEKVKVKLQSAWPDYVFDSTYVLPSLQDVAAFIKTSGHLPGMPSSKEVATDHLDIGENQAAIVKKVEELTLYLLQQQELIKAQQQTIQQMQEQLRRLQEK